MDKNNFKNSSDESKKDSNSNRKNENLNHSNFNDDRDEEIFTLSEKNETLSQEIYKRDLEINEFNQ